MEILISIAILALLFSSVVAGPNDDAFEEVRVGLVVDLSSIQGKILETSFNLALSDFYGINNGYRTRVSVLVRDSHGDPIIALAAGEFHLPYSIIAFFLIYLFGRIHNS